MKRFQTIGKAFIKMNKKIKNKFLKKSYFQCWWFRSIFLYSVIKIQKVFRGFYFRKSELGQLLKKEFKKFKKNYKMCRKFRRNCLLKNIFFILRENFILCQNERNFEEEKFKIKKYFHRYYQFSQIRMKISYLDYRRNLLKKEKKVRKGMFLLQYVAAKNILQKNIHLESLLYYRNFLLFHGFTRLLTKKQKELKKSKFFRNNRLRNEQKNRIISKKSDFRNNNYNDYYNYNSKKNNYNHSSNEYHNKDDYHNKDNNYDNNRNFSQDIYKCRNNNFNKKKVQILENNLQQLTNSISLRQVVDLEPDSRLKTSIKIKNDSVKKKDFIQDYSNFYSPFTKKNLRRKGFRNFKIYQENRYFERYFFLCCERHWAFPYFEQFFKLLKMKKMSKMFLKVEMKKIKSNATQRLFLNWRKITFLKKRKNQLRISKVFN